MAKHINSRYINSPLWYLPSGIVFNKNFMDFYKKILTPKRTGMEIGFITKTLGLEPGMKVLDLGCGWGRHTIALAKKGYKMTGQDINPFFLEEGRKEASAEGVSVRWIERNMRNIAGRKEFNAILNLFSSFGYYEREEDHQAVFYAVARALRRGGYFLIDVINREKILHPYQAERVIKTKEGAVLKVKAKFDLMTSRSNERRVLKLEGRRKKEYSLTLRIFTLTELIAMARKANLSFVACFGGYKGNPIDLRSPRCILIVQKKV